jgi:hypothetical protein
LIVAPQWRLHSPWFLRQWGVAVSVLCWLALASTSAWAGPELVVLIRHGHKDREQQTPNYNLSESGFLQALQLSLLLPACLAEGRTLHLGGYGFDPASGKNARSYQTLVPLAVASGRNIELFADAAEQSSLIGQRLRDDPRFDGGVLVLAWEHRRLPALARGLGWNTMPMVDDDNFDGLWLLRYSPAGQLASVQSLSQRHLQSRDCFRRIRLDAAPVVRTLNNWMKAVEP